MSSKWFGKPALATLAALATASAVAFSSGCGESLDSPPDAVSTSGSESDAAATDTGEVLAVSSVSAILGSTETTAAQAQAVARTASGSATEVPICQPLNDALIKTCANGTASVTYDKCHFSGASADLLWSGGAKYDFLSANGTPACPSSFESLKILGGSVTKTYAHDTHRISPEVTVNVDTSAGGTRIQFQPGGRTILIQGVHYVASRIASRRHKTEVVWDHEVSTPRPMTVAESGSSRTVDGTVVLKQNLAGYSASVEFKGVVYVPSQCVCQPVSGTITSTYSGSRSGAVSVEITGCGTGKVTDASTGAVTPVTFSHCL